MATVFIENESTVTLHDTGIDIVVVSEPGLMGPRAELPWELSLPVDGSAYANERLLRYDAPDIITFNIPECYASCDYPATSNSAFRLLVSNSSVTNSTIGTITFTPGNRVANVSITAVSINKRDILNVYAPVSQDPTLADITITLKGER